MKNVICVSLLALSLAACQTSGLKGKAHTGFEQYSAKAYHKAFFVHQNNDGGFVYGYSSQKLTRLEAYNAAEKLCNAYFDKVNFRAECEVYAIDDIKVSSMQKEEITKLLNATSVTPRKPLGKQRIDIFRKLEDGKMVFKGTMAPTTSGRSKLDVTLSDTKCSGEGVYIKGEYNTKTLPQGTWNLKCDNGRFASGTYKSSKLHTGIATGIDNLGEKIELVYRPNDL